MASLQRRDEFPDKEYSFVFKTFRHFFKKIFSTKNRLSNLQTKNLEIER